MSLVYTYIDILNRGSTSEAKNYGDTVINLYLTKGSREGTSTLTVEQVDSVTEESLECLNIYNLTTEQFKSIANQIEQLIKEIE